MPASRIASTSSPGSQACVAGDHGRGQAAAERPHALDDPPGQAPAGGVQPRHQPEGQGRLEQGDGLGRADGEAGAADPVEEGVAGEVVGAGASAAAAGFGG